MKIYENRRRNAMEIVGVHRMKWNGQGAKDGRNRVEVNGHGNGETRMEKSGLET